MNRRFNPRKGIFEVIGNNIFKKESSSAPVHPDSFEILSNSPRILYYPQFLSDHECDIIMDFGRSGMGLSKKELIRNRFVAHLPHADMLANASIAHILKRISAQTKHPINMFQVSAFCESECNLTCLLYAMHMWGSYMASYLFWFFFFFFFCTKAIQVIEIQ